MVHKGTSDSAAYRAKKDFFNSLLTVYGRKPVLEALEDPQTKIYRLHLADSNRSGDLIERIIAAATAKGAEIVYHDRKALARISKNSKQDQGVAADLICARYTSHQQFLQSQPGQAPHYTLLALDRITNPQNLGMIIRSASAGRIDGILLPSKGCAPIDPLVIKASAGTVFRAPILRCEDLSSALADFSNSGALAICALSSHASVSLKDFSPKGPCIYVLGNETEGVSAQVAQHCNQTLKIPMNNGVESLNVAVTAALIAFRGQV
ncbi:RNA methyltransferase [Marinimicrobium sp. ABcell2]|uniref:TrmH family RNA methyltransferase n=1 Tax=Marinimicrobium sp. ABcell2 TaxID=3069751 RepID=UPI0027B12FFA|nr:RNA methyltransferase [Marinimicrobium sp. ABcell2]MDQ2075548.1 RNA methyltransferase [Marinimicrobium sp. ABcell2]